MTEHWVENTARGLYRWERNEGWTKDDDLCDFEEGDAITIAPFRERAENSRLFWPVYGTFIEYVTDDIAKVYIPPVAEETKTRSWFRGEEGEYLIHEGYLTPQ